MNANKTVVTGSYISNEEIACPFKIIETNKDEYNDRNPQYKIYKVSLDCIPADFIEFNSNATLKMEIGVDEREFTLTHEQYQHFVTEVLNKRVNWTITVMTPWYKPNETIRLPGTWTTMKLMKGGRKHSRCMRKHSGRKHSRCMRKHLGRKPK
jgi:hypothetical protein